MEEKERQRREALLRRERTYDSPMRPEAIASPSEPPAAAPASGNYVLKFCRESARGAGHSSPPDRSDKWAPTDDRPSQPPRSTDKWGHPYDRPLQSNDKWGQSDDCRPSFGGGSRLPSSSWCSRRG